MSPVYVGFKACIEAFEVGLQGQNGGGCIARKLRQQMRLYEIVEKILLVFKAGLGSPVEP